MKRGNTILDNISKLNTFVLMSKSNEFLSIYVEKILNKKSKTMKFIADFDCTTLDILYTSLQLINNDDNKHKFYNKIDKKELKYYLDKVKGLNFFKRQNHAMKNEEILIQYLIDALSHGAYVCGNNNTVRFNNGLIIDANYLVEFASFLITSLNLSSYLSHDNQTYSFKLAEFKEPRDKDLKKYLKELKIYEYSVVRKDHKPLNYQNIKYLYDILSITDKYDFKKLQDINSILSKENFYLSINKTTPIFNKSSKNKIEKLFNEEDYDTLQEYIKKSFNCQNSNAVKNKNDLLLSFELLRSLAHAYKTNCSIEECRKAFNLDGQENKLKTALAIANFYITYMYDEENLQKYFNFELLHLSEIKPSIIDYETIEYKTILNDLSTLNKKVVLENRKINKYLAESRHLSKKDRQARSNNNYNLANSCLELENLVKKIKILRENLTDAKDNNLSKNNINKTKIKYIKESIIKGNYVFNLKNKTLTFNTFSEKDYHRTFVLEITLNDFIEQLLSDYNRNLKINFYQI